MTNLFGILAESMAGVDFPVCPICTPIGESHNLKICVRCQEDLLNKLDEAIDPEVKLVKCYCNN
jgi:hypothetical protein